MYSEDKFTKHQTKGGKIPEVQNVVNVNWEWVAKGKESFPSAHIYNCLNSNIMIAIIFHWPSCPARRTLPWKVLTCQTCVVLHQSPYYRHQIHHWNISICTKYSRNSIDLDTFPDHVGLGESNGIVPDRCKFVRQICLKSIVTNDAKIVLPPN